MPRLLGVEVPANKPVYVAVSYLFGIGRRNGVDLARRAQVDPLRKASDLSDDELARITALLDSEFVVEGSLRRSIAADIGRMRDIKCYRGLRHKRGLPVRGQRTRTNARTRKGVKKTVAGKKGVKDMKH